MIKTLLFDLDNTLFRYDDGFERFIKRLGQRYSKKFDEAELELIKAKNEMGYAPRLEFFAWFAAEFEIEESAESLWSILQKGFADYILVNDATKTMLKTFSKQLKVGIVTNGSLTTQWNKIRRTRLDKILSNIFVSGELGFSKPDPELFRLVCEKMESSPEQALYVGDHWANDIEGAKAAGLKTCWLSYGAPVPLSDGNVCDFLIASLEELEPLLELYV